MKMVYFGTDVFLDTFRYFQKECEIMALYTYHNEEDYMMEYSIVEEAKKSGIPIYYNKINENDMEEYIRKGCELFFLAEYAYLIPVPKEETGAYAINVHSSLLPEGRGYYPIENAMIQGIKKTGITMHRISPQADCGDIIEQREVTISDTEDSIDIYLKCGKKALEMAKALMSDFETEISNAKPQGVKKPYCKRPDESFMQITHDMTVEQAYQVYRCFNKMTKVYLQEEKRNLYVEHFEKGRELLELEDKEWKIDSNKVLFSLKDGHVRLIIKEI